MGLTTRAWLAVFATGVTTIAQAGPPGHPRLYFTPDELQALRERHDEGARRLIYQNLLQSADWCLTRPLRAAWIAPVAPDPVYANLYDRFYAMMHDMAVMEHLAFAWSYSREPRFLAPAKAWALACCRVWRREADGAADASKAYAVLRLLKGLATAYDLLHAELSESERGELRAMLAEVGGKYHQWYLDNPAMGTVAGQGPHHASVETASFGIAALALLGEVPQADDWLRLMVAKHRQSLLPEALAADGAQVEGATFWASTMQYRIAFMDALRRVTGEDLFTPFAKQMDARLALASIAAGKTEGPDQDHDSVVLEPSYGQLDYYSPVLLALAREYRRPLYQQLALWDRTVGGVQRSRYVTDNGEWMLFDWGGYAYAWYDPTVSAAHEPGTPLSFAFPSVNEAYLRESYEPGGIVVGQRRNAVVIHAGGRPVFVDVYDIHHLPGPVPGLALQDDGTAAALTCQGAADSGFAAQTVSLRRPGQVTVKRKTDNAQSWWCYGKPVQAGNALRWEDGTVLAVTQGTIASVDPAGYHDEKVVGMGLLRLKDPTPMTYALVTAQPQDGQLVLEVRRGGG